MYHINRVLRRKFINVKDTGAMGDGMTDDTAAIQVAVDKVSGTGGTLFIPAGIYMIDALTSVKLGSDMTLRMHRDAVLQAIPNAATHYKIIIMVNATNVNIINGTIKGERDEHLTSGNYTGSGGQWGMGIAMYGCSHIVMRGVTARDCWGDGFYLAQNSTDIIFHSVVADNNRRQGMSIVWADGVVVRDSIFENTKGHNPMAGIDLEPNAGEIVSNVQILDSQFTNNYFAAIELHGRAGPIRDITISGNIVNGSQHAIRLTEASGVTVTDNTIVDRHVGFFTRGDLTESTITGNTITAPVCFEGDFGDNIITDNICNGL